jgi:CPA2 family monovalent cation:H+ antiporter-2
LGQISVFFIVVVVVGMLAVPPLLRSVARYKSNEMMLVTVLGLCFGVSLLTVKLGYSVALGAFLIGTIIGEVREIAQIKLLTEPVRDMFSAVFFVSIGMLIDPVLLWEYAVPTAVITGAVLIGKVITRSIGVFIAGNDTRTSLRVAMTLAQIGEFSFIIAALGIELKVTSGFIYPIAVSVSVVTTLLTPLLVRSSDGLAERFDRRAPRWLVEVMELYSRWLSRLRSDRRDSPARRFGRKWSWQIFLNLAVASGLFMGAAAVAGHARQWWPNAPGWLGGPPGLIWLGAAVVALPCLIAAVRKLQALALLISEASVPTAKDAAGARSVIYHIVFGAGITGIAVWVLLLSSTLLPTGPSLIVLGGITLGLTAVLWRFFVKMHAKAQVAILESFAALPLPPEAHERRRLPAVLNDAELESVTLPAASESAGKLIRELGLRTRTGASIVGIQRGVEEIVNPGPDEELQAGDVVLLLGTASQLVAARALLTGS